MPALLREVSVTLIQEKYHGFAKIYTDGSVDKVNNKEGAAYYCPETGDSFSLPCDVSSSMNAELLALNAALEFYKAIDARDILSLIHI